MGDSTEPAAGASSMPTMLSQRSGDMVTDDTAQAGLINSYLQQSLALANREGRLVSGFSRVLDKVLKESSCVLFCILPENLWCEKSHAAFFSLFLSTCHQNGVRMIKVDHDQLVRKIIDATTDPAHPGPAVSSYECLAVTGTDDGSSGRSGRALCDCELVKFYESRYHGQDFDLLPTVNLMDS